MANRTQNSRHTGESGAEPLGRREPALGVAIVLVILNIMGLILAVLERISPPLLSPGLGGTLPAEIIGGLRLTCLLVAFLLLLLWTDLTSPRGLLKSQKLKVARVADWILLCAATLVGIGLGGVIYHALTELILSPFLGF